jgi:hypothetical protein
MNAPQRRRRAGRDSRGLLDSPFLDREACAESPEEAGLAVAADMPSSLGGEAPSASDSAHQAFAGQGSKGFTEASRASGSTPWRFGDESSSGSAPCITLFNPSCLVSANTDPASSKCQHPADGPGSCARPGCTTSRWPGFVATHQGDTDRFPCTEHLHGCGVSLWIAISNSRR